MENPEDASGKNSPSASAPPNGKTSPSEREAKQRTVLVENISMSMTVSQLQHFFAFCGQIKEISLVLSSDTGTQTAVIEFERKDAASTALLLSQACLFGSTITVRPYLTEVEQLVGPNSKAREETEDDGDEVFEDAVETLEPLRQEDKPKLSIMVELLANGYVLNDKILEKAKEFDEQRGISDTFKRYLISAHNKGLELNEKYRVVETGQELAQKATEKALDIAQNLDEKYQLKDKLHTAKEEAQKKAHEIDQKYHVVEKVGAAKSTAVMYAGKAIKSETGQRISGFLTDAWKKAKAINDEAKERAAEKEANESKEKKSGDDSISMEEVELNLNQ